MKLTVLPKTFMNTTKFLKKITTFWIERVLSSEMTGHDKHAVARTYWPTLLFSDKDIGEQDIMLPI